MKKKLMMIGLAAFVISAANASTCGASQAGCDKTAVAVSAEEAAFVSKLSSAQSQAFNLMSAEQRQEVVAAAHKGAMTPDVAVDTVLSNHHLAIVDGALKTSNVK